ncbi:MAG: hypothetical protein J6Q15_02545, partial [Clostridia bacterium]|nr:hypothetical protein [Clostridia bacterium]
SAGVSSTTRTRSTSTTRSTTGAKSSATGTRTTARAGATRMSAEDKLKKSIKNLSYTSSGTSSVDVAKEKPTASKTTSRKKVGGVVLDVETIQDATKQKFETRGRRNNVIILVLSLLLVVSLVYLAITVISYIKGKQDPNFKYFISGDAQAEWIIEGGSDTQFTLHQDFAADTVYLVNSKLKIKCAESVMLSLDIKVLFNGEEILIAGLYYKDPDKDLNDRFSRAEGTNTFVFLDTIRGGTTINLFDGLDFAEAPYNINYKNVTIQVTANVNKI